jgi:outer membrane lipoprotein-sorting protein
MCVWRQAGVLLLVCMSFASSSAEDKKSLPWNAIVRSPPAQASEQAQHLTKRQLEVVRRVNDYFNQLTMLEGSFLQTAADGKRQGGKFHIMRPGRFRFEFAPPSRVVIISDGKYFTVQDYDLKTDDRRDLSQTPFRALLRAEVDLLRDAVISEVSETDDTIIIGFKDISPEAGSIRLFLGTKPVARLKGWITRDNQNLDTRIDLTEMEPVASIDQRLFDPSSRLERRRW